MAIVPGKPKICLQENLVDSADCGGFMKGEPRTTTIIDDDYVGARKRDVMTSEPELEVKEITKVANRTDILL